MNRKKSEARLDELLRFAKENGASDAKAVSARDVFVDKRVRLKCSVPLCSSYGRNLMCPPNLMSVDEFSDVLGLYEKAILVQVEADIDSSDKAGKSLDKKLCEELDRSTDSAKWQKRLHKLVNCLETEAFKQGFYLAAGLTGGECSLCGECASARNGERCRHPFEARPSMEAMGIDVIRTCEKAGMPVRLSSKSKIRWTGIVLLY
jgi:predicted metal-binding protein